MSKSIDFMKTKEGSPDHENKLPMIAAVRRKSVAPIKKRPGHGGGRKLGPDGEPLHKIKDLKIELKARRK